MLTVIDAIDDADVALDSLRRLHAEKLSWRLVLMIEQLQTALLVERMEERKKPALPDNKSAA
jgi:hypothetical protein